MNIRAASAALQRALQGALGREVPEALPLSLNRPRVAPGMEYVDNMLRGMVKGSQEGNTYAALSRIEPEFDPRFLGGMHHKSGILTVQEEQPLEDIVQTVAHEFQHADDWRNRPAIFDNYPRNSLQAAVERAPKGYYSHPAEINAEKRGLLEAHLFKSDLDNQLSFPRPYLRQLADRQANYKGQLNEDLNSLPGADEWEALRNSLVPDPEQLQLPYEHPRKFFR